MLSSFPVRALRISLAWVVAFSIWLPALAVFAVLPRRVLDRFLHRFIRWWGRLTLRILGAELHIEGQSHLEDARARVVVLNHQSALDLIWGAAVVPPRCLVIGKREIIWVPGVNLVWWVLGFVRIDRGSRRRAVAALKGLAERLVAEERSLLIAPEGTRTLDGALLPFKKGAFHVAVEAGCPVCPMVIRGAWELMPKGEWFPYPGRLRLRFLEPVSTEGLGKEDLPALVQVVRRRMAEAYEEMG